MENKTPLQDLTHSDLTVKFNKLLLCKIPQSELWHRKVRSVEMEVYLYV